MFSLARRGNGSSAKECYGVPPGVTPTHPRGPQQTSTPSCRCSASQGPRHPHRSPLPVPLCRPGPSSGLRCSLVGQGFLFSTIWDCVCFVRFASSVGGFGSFQITGHGGGSHEGLEEERVKKPKRFHLQLLFLTGPKLASQW